jgi:hypothetical protein
MNRRIAATILPLAMLLAPSLEAVTMVPIQVDNKPDTRIEIVPIDEAHRASIPSSLSTSVALPAGSFILVNHTKTSITAIAVRWTYTDVGGELQQRGINCDAYVFAPLDPIVEPNDLSLITPYGCTKRDLFPNLATGAFIGSPLTPIIGNPLSVRMDETMHVYVDSIIFEDGQIWGPDKFHYYAEIQDRHSAVLKFVAEVTAGRSTGEGLQELAGRIRKDAESKPDTLTSKSSSRRAYYAGLLQRSPNPEASLQQLQAQTPPPIFRHIGEQHQ